MPLSGHSGHCVRERPVLAVANARSRPILSLADGFLYKAAKGCASLYDNVDGDNQQVRRSDNHLVR